jgi:hypothetical protein
MFTFSGLRTQTLDSRIRLLAKHYDLLPGASDKEILLKLAEDFVPRFSARDPSTKVGRNKFWNDVRSAALVADIDRTNELHNGGVRDSAMRLTKKEPWKTLLSKTNGGGGLSDAAETLRARYVTTKRRKNSWVKRDQIRRIITAEGWGINDDNASSLIAWFALTEPGNIPFK